MTYQILIDIGLGILALIATFISYFCHVKSKLINSVPGTIDDVEIDGKVGKEKFDEAVNIIMERIPAILKPFIKRTYVEMLVQKTFDKIKDFAKKQNK